MIRAGLLIMLAGCTVPPTEPLRTSVSAPIEVDARKEGKETKEKKPPKESTKQPTAIVTAPNKPTPPCPPKNDKPKTDQERIIEKLDCLLERK